MARPTPEQLPLCEVPATPAPPAPEPQPQRALDLKLYTVHQFSLISPEDERRIQRHAQQRQQSQPDT
jgi:hypothetical protein